MTAPVVEADVATAQEWTAAAAQLGVNTPDAALFARERAAEHRRRGASTGTTVAA